MRHGRIDGDAARGEPILVVGTGGAEVGRAHGGEPVGLQVGRHDAKAREPGARFQIVRGMAVGNIEQRRGVENFARAAVFDDMHAHRVGRVFAEMEKLARHAPVGFEPQALLGPVADLLVAVVIDLGEDFGRGHGRHDIGTLGELGGAALQFLEGESRQARRVPQN